METIFISGLCMSLSSLDQRSHKTSEDREHLHILPIFAVGKQLWSDKHGSYSQLSSQNSQNICDFFTLCIVQISLYIIIYLVLNFILNYIPFLKIVHHYIPYLKSHCSYQTLCISSLTFLLMIKSLVSNVCLVNFHNVSGEDTLQS